MKKLGIVALLFTVVFLAINIIVDKFILTQGLDPLTLATLKVSIILVILFPIFIYRKKGKKIPKASIKDLIIIGVLASGFVQFMRLFGLNFTTSINASFIAASSSVFSVIFAYFIIKERLPKRFFIVLLMMFTGVFLISTKGEFIVNYGDIIFLAMAMVLGFTNVWANKTMKKVESLFVTYGRVFFGSLSLILLFFIFSGSLEYVNILWPYVLLTGVIGAIVLVSFYEGIRIEGASIASTFLIFYPLITVFLAFIFLEEAMTIVQIVGGALMIISLLFLSKIEALSN